MKLISIALVAVLAVALVPGIAYALNPGDVIMSSPKRYLFSVDQGTGQRTIISGMDLSDECEEPGVPYSCCTGSLTGDGSPPCGVVGGGIHWYYLGAVGVAADGSLLVLANDGYPGYRALFRVDPDTGDRTVISSNSDGQDVQLSVVDMVVVPGPGYFDIAALPPFAIAVGVGFMLGVSYMVGRRQAAQPR